MPPRESTDKPQARRGGLFNLSTLRILARGRIPGQVVIQYTDRCNASCVQCGMRVSKAFPRNTMDVDRTKRLLDAMAERGVQSISFTGGEPLLCLDEIVVLARHAGRAGIRYIRTGTNGFIFRGAHKADFRERMERVAATIADTPINTFWVSVDSAVPEVHEQNRGLYGVVEGMRKGLDIFHEHGLYPSANLGINRYTGGRGELALPLLGSDSESGAVEEALSFEARAREAFARFYGFVGDLGFTIVNACYPMSCDAEEAEAGAVYAATSADDFIRFSTREKTLLFRALHDTLPAFRSKLRIFTPQSSLQALIRQYEGGGGGTYGCRGGVDFFFIDAKTMDTYPCGYRGTENLGKFWDLDLDGLGTTPDCTRCDWECFRDPSELIGPFTDICTHPVQLAKRFVGDRDAARTWWRDLCYYRACDYFDGRNPPNYEKLARFA